MMLYHMLSTQLPRSIKVSELLADKDEITFTKYKQ